MFRIVRAIVSVGLVLLVIAALGSRTMAGGQTAQFPQASAGPGQTFRGLFLRTHPDSGAARSQVYLVHADEIVMNDGARVEGWKALAADIGASGAGGLDAGSRAPSTWYEIHAIRSSLNGTKNLLLHRAKDYLEDQVQTRTAAAETLADSADRTTLAQGFQVGVRGKVEFVDVSLRKNGSPSGRMWLTIESGGTGAVAATSDHLQAANLPATTTFIRFVFRAPPELVASTDYRLVLHGDFAVHSANNVSWLGEAGNAYPRGSSEQRSGTAWSPTATVQDFAFRIYVTENDTAVVMPAGYDERAKIGYVYNNRDGALDGFVAMDREVMPLTWAGTGDFPNRTPVLIDLREHIPPGPIRLELSAANTQALNRVTAGPVPPGFDAGALSFNRSEGGQTSVVVASPSDAQTAMLGRMITEYQAGYFFTTGGRARVYVSMWAW